MNFLILSNGYGEDQVGSKLVNELNIISQSSSKFFVMPVVGDGKAYKTCKNTNILGPHRIFKSGGFLRRLKDIYIDITDGLISHHFRQIKNLISLKKKENLDVIIAVGDFFLVLISFFIFKKKIYFIPTAKSDKFQKHFWIEKYIIKKACNKIFPRDDVTSRSFNEFGLNSSYLGNVIMDTIEDTSNMEVMINSENKNIVILPGSRVEAYENINKISLILKKYVEITNKEKYKVSYYISLPETLDEITFKDIVEENKINIIKGKFKTLIENADLVLGIAGTANEQACLMGKPVVAFEGYGPQTTKKRFIEQNKLLGKGLIFVDGNEIEIANAIHRVLNDKQLLNEIKENVKVYENSIGAIGRIAKEIINEFV